MEISSLDFKKNVYDYDTVAFQGKRPVMVELYTDWCTACKSMSPMLDALDTKYKETMDVIKVNVSKADDLVQALQIQGVPTILFMRPGRGVMKTLVGACNSVLLEKAITEYLS